MKGLFIPYYADCGSKQLLQAVGVIGAIIIPHTVNLVLVRTVKNNYFPLCTN